MKKTILYIIDSLNGIGGTEQAMVASLKDIRNSYDVILVTLLPEHVFNKEDFFGSKQFCLHMTSRFKIFSAARDLKKIIRENNVVFVHSFLYWSTLVARLACGKKTIHLFKLTTVMSLHVYKNKWYSGYTKLLDRLTYKKDQVVISPTNVVLDDFDRTIGIKGKFKIVPNFVLNNFFEKQFSYKRPMGTLRLVAVGNIKGVKNYQVVIDALMLLKGLPVSVDIYGRGRLKKVQEKQINENELPINIMGTHGRIYEVLPAYDAFIMSSFVEGFGISAAEAMAIGLPLLLSEIEVFKEVSGGNALFFDPYDAKSLAFVIATIFENKIDLQSMSEKGKAIAAEKYTKQKYINDLLDLYKCVGVSTSF